VPTLRRWGWGLFSLALGIAVEVSGVRGLLAAELAWAAVFAGLFLLWLAWWRGRPGRTTRGAARGKRSPPLDRVVTLLGRKILAFLYARDVGAPGWDSSESTLRHPVRASKVRRALRAYEQDTMSMYRQRFAPDVRRALRQLIGAHVGRNEAHDLLYPRNVHETEAVGHRLVEIGEVLRSRVDRAA
jgi:hypothetical protein